MLCRFQGRQFSSTVSRAMMVDVHEGRTEYFAVLSGINFISPAKCVPENSRVKLFYVSIFGTLIFQLSVSHVDYMFINGFMPL